MNFLTKIALVVCLAYLVDRSSACSCLPGHPQQAWCNGALAFGFRAWSRSRVNVTIDFRPTDPSGLIEFPSIHQREMYRYRISSFYLYQGNNNYNSTFRRLRYIYTSLSSASCGVNLEFGSKYVIIGGHYSDGRMEVVLCNHIFNRNRMTFKTNFLLSLNLLYYYDEGCKCTVKDCIFDTCVDPRPNNECYTSDLRGLPIPYSQTTCRPYKKNCLWSDGFNIIPPKPQVTTTFQPLVPKSTLQSIE